MTRHWFGAAVLLLAATACNGDDDDATDTSAPETTAPETVASTSSPPTTEASTTTTTTEAPTTTLSAEEALKAQIAADYLRIEQALEDLSRNPTAEGLDERVGAVAVAGSSVHTDIVSSIRDRLATGERIVPGDPDYSDVFVESVELIDGPESGLAQVTACLVTNQIRLDAQGQAIGGPTEVVAARIRQPVQQTSNGWLFASAAIRVGIREGLTSCNF